MKKIFISVLFAAAALLSNFNSAFAFWEACEESILSVNPKYVYNKPTYIIQNKKNQPQEIIPILYKDNFQIENSISKSKTILDFHLIPKPIEHYLTIKNTKPKEMEEPKDKKNWVELIDIKPRGCEKLTCFVTQEFNKDGTPVFTKTWHRSFFTYTLNKGSA